MAVTAGKFVGVGPMTNINLTFTDDLVAKYPRGTTAQDQLGNIWIYVQFAATTALGDACKVKKTTVPTTTEPWQIIPLAAAGEVVFGISPLAHTSTYYGWLLRYGQLIGDAKLISSAVADGDPLVSSGTAGTLTISTAADIGGVRAYCMIDDTDNTGTVLLV